MNSNREYSVPNRSHLRTAAILTLTAILGFMLAVVACADGPCDLARQRQAEWAAARAAAGVDAPLFFALQPGDSKSRFITEAQLHLPSVSGVTIRVRPEWLSVNGKWDFSYIDQCRQRCQNTGDRYKLLLMGGGSDPLSEASLKFYEAAAAALGARYDGDPLLYAPHISGTSPVGVSEELHWERPMPAKAIAATMRIANAWMNAFPRHKAELAISPKDSAAMDQIINYVNSKYPGRLIVKNNSLKATTSLTAPQSKTLIFAGQAGCGIAWEAVGSTRESRFGGTLQQAYDKAKAIAKSAGKPISVIDWYVPDLSKVGALR